MVDFELLQTALGGVYDTALTDEAWPVALRQLCGVFSCHFADAFERTLDYKQSRGIQVGLDERDYQDVFLGYWAKNNVWGTRRPTRRAGDIVATRDMISQQELQRSDMYSEFLGPRRLEEGLRLDIYADEDGVEDISLLRPWSAGPYSPDELRAARLLMPHLRRASVVRRRLADSATMAEAGLASLDQVPMGVLLLRHDGRVAYANGAAEALLALKDPISVGPDGLTAATATSTRALQRLIHDASGRNVDAPRSGSLRLPCASDRPAVLAVAVPIRPGAHDRFDLLRPMALLCLIDRGLHRTPTPDHVVALFALTRSEAELTSGLLSGSSLQDIAQSSGRSVHTVRSLLSRVMAKTETNRQAELVRLLMRLPRGVG